MAGPQKMQQALDASGLGVRDFAEKHAINQSTLTRALAGQSVPNAHTMAAMHEAAKQYQVAIEAADWMTVAS